MVTELEERVQRERFFAIVDEVDNILIDEARTPLIISGQAEESADLYYTFARLVPKLQARPEGAEEGGDYFVDLKDKAVSPTEDGVDRMEKLLGVENLYDADPRLARYFEQALRAHALYRRDKDYLVKDGEIVIVDEFTGRLMPGRRWCEGLHQAIEAKEGLRVQRESVTLATITFQNYFRLYDKLAGMTGTAMTEGEEFHKIYKLEVVAIPTNMPMVRDDDADLVFRNENGKFSAVIDEIEEMTGAGRPVLVGTVSVEKSEILGELLRRRGIGHEVLNAKFHEKEAGIVAQAGRTAAVTIATNMAGRGTDIVLGGNPAGLTSMMLHQRGLNPAEVDKATYDEVFREAKARCDTEHDVVVAAGGLHIIGTERHESRRIDNQLRGRAGRQGDPGSSRFYLSLDDDLMKRFASDRVAGLMERLGLEDDVAIESRLVSKTIESAQSRVEGYNFDIRKHVVEFDDVINKQRETIYAERDKVLHNEDLTDTVRAFLDEELEAPARPALRQRASRRLGHRGSLDGPARHGPRRRGHERGRALGGRRPRGAGRAPARAGRCAAGGEGSRHRRDRVGDGGAPGAPAHDRLPLGGAPHRARRHAARHRPPRLRPAGSAQRVQEGGVQPLRPAAGAHPAPGGDDDLPGPGREAAADADARRGAARREPRGGRHGHGHRSPPRGRTAGGRCLRSRGREPRWQRRRGPRPADRARDPRHAAAGRGPRGGARPGRRAGREARPQRSLPLRLGAQIQEVPRALSPAGRGCGGGLRSAGRKLPLGHSAFAAYTPADAAHAHGERTR